MPDARKSSVERCMMARTSCGRRLADAARVSSSLSLSAIVCISPVLIIHPAKSSSPEGTMRSLFVYLASARGKDAAAAQERPFREFIEWTRVGRT